MPGQPIVLADRWDNPGGGVAGDSTVMVEALLRHPEVPAAIGAHVGPGRRELLPGGRRGRRDPAALRRQGRRDLRAARSTRTCAFAPPRRISIVPFEQSLVSLGPAAAITIGNLDVVLASTRAQTFSPPVFTNLGIDLAAKKIVVVKSSNHFYAAFSQDCGRRSSISTPAGPTLPIRTKVTYTKVRRPLAPLDPHPWL